MEHLVVSEQEDEGENLEETDQATDPWDRWDHCVGICLVDGDYWTDVDVELVHILWHYHNIFLSRVGEVDLLVKLLVNAP